MFEYRTHGTCAQRIFFDVKDGNVHSIEFEGGCNGNLKAIAKLCEGMKAEKVIETLQGIDCGGKGTSCGDQLAMGIKKALEHGGA